MMSGILWDAVNFVVTLFEMVVTYYFFNSMMGLKPDVGRFKNYTCIFGITVILSVVYKLDIAILLAVMNVVLRVIYAMLFNESIKYKVYYALSFFVFEFLGEIIGSFLLIIILKKDFQVLSQNNYYHFFGIVISKLFMLIPVIQMCSIKNYKNIKISVQHWILLLSIPLISSIFFIVIGVYIKITDYAHQIILFVMTLSAIYNYIVIGFLMSKLLHIMQNINMNNLLNQQKNYQLKFYENMRASDKVIKGVKHDLNNHLQCIHDLLSANRFSQAKDYTETVFNAVNVGSKIINTGNAVFDSILNAKISVMNSDGIKFDHTIEIPAGLKVNPVDMCVILGNALDNSIEACRRIKNGPKKISMIAVYRNKGLILSIKNTADDGSIIKRDDTYKTTKDNPSEHGIGLSNITRTADKYDGIVITRNNAGIFELSAALYNV